MVGILQWPGECRDLAKRMGGRWPIVERFDDPDLLRLGVKLVDANGAEVVEALVDFVSERMTAMGTALKTAVDAPIPRASVSTAMAANDFVRQSPR